jgi:outer membrane biosynthesis protein TonB
MNSTIRNLIIAAPLATAALTMVPTSAMATDGPVIIVQPKADPEPPTDKIAIPKPKPPVEPKDKVALPKPKPPVGPDDKVGPKPKPTQPDGPDVITNPEPCPTHGDCGNDDKDGPNNGGGGGDDSSDDTTPVDKVNKVNKVQADDVVDVPTRIDAGLASEQSDDGLELGWLLAGGALVTATGAAFALRTRKRHDA